MTDLPFRWAAGVECSFIPHLGIDQYRWTQHDRYWRTDFELIANDLGCRWLRYSLPWHEIEREPGQYDWTWFDERLALAESLGITLLLDLVHFGTPTWLPESFADPDFPHAVERLARVFGERYKGRVHHVCPVNEPLITALFCGDIGLWPPYGQGLHSYTTVLNRVAQGACRAIEVLRATMPGVEILISDSLEVAVTYEDSDEKSSPFLRESLRADVARRMERRHIVLDLIMGRMTKKHPLYSWLEKHGFSAFDLRWFQRHAQTIDIIGLDYYEHTEVELFTTPEGYYRQRQLTPPVGLYQAAQDYWTRYHIPLMITETSVSGSDEDKIRWLQRSVADVRRLRAEGFQVVGYTWWPVFDHLDWDGALLHQTGHIHPVGIYRLERQAGGKLARVPTGLRDEYRALIAGGEETAGPLIESDAQRESRRKASEAATASTVLRYPVIVHGRARWDKGLIWRRGQHVSTHLSKHHRVVYVDPIHWLEGEDEHPNFGMSFYADFPNVYNLIIRLPIGFRGDDKLVRQEGRRLLAEALSQAPLAGNFDAPVQWFETADTASVFGGQVNAQAVVYDCVDREPDENLLKLADVVFASGSEVQDAIVRQGRTDSHLAPNGVHVRHFLRALGNRIAIPHDVNFVPRPMLVYFGTIDERIDYDLIRALAENNEAWSVVMIGPVQGVNPEGLPRRRNIFWIGQRPYGDMPDYAHAARVCIVPFLISEATRYQRPVKIGEYLMSGRPVVSTALPEVVREFGEVVKVAVDHAEFIESCHKAIHEKDEQMVRRGLRRMAAQGWPKLVATMDQVVTGVLKG